MEHSPDPPEPDELGATTYNPEPTFESDVFCDGADQTWTRRITKATFRQRQQIRHGGAEITDDSIAAATSCSSLLEMAKALVKAMEVATPMHFWTPRSVIEAHEDVHAANASAYVPQLYAEFVSDVEQIKISSAGVDHDKALADTEAAYKVAKDKFDEARKAAGKNDAKHLPPDPFVAAQRTAAEPWYDKVSARYSALQCPEDLPQPPDI